MPSIKVFKSTGYRTQILLARKRQQPLGQRSAALGALQGAIDQTMQLGIVRHALAQQIEIAHHGHQQVVEVVRDAAGELADRLHLLRLPQLFLRLFAGGNFLHQFGGALIDALFQRGAQFRQRGALGRQLPQQIVALDVRGLARGDVGADADQHLMLPSGRRTTRARVSHPMHRTVRPDVAVFDLVIARLP